jgi:alanine racemase
VQDSKLRRIVVDCRIIEENLKLIGRNLGERTLPIWVVKSHAYGFGLDCIRHVSSPIAGYGAEDFVAAGKVLAVDQSKPVYILYPISPAYCPDRLLPRVWDGSILPTVAGKNQIDQWVLSARKAGVDAVDIQIKVRSFGGRFGIPPEELAGTVAYARKRGLTIRGLFSHPSHSTVSTRREVRKECEQFVKQAREIAPEAFVHFSDSACVLKGIGIDLDLVRVGMLPLGLLPEEPGKGWASSLKLAITVYARVVSIHALGKGEGVGYNLQVGNAPSQVAIAAMGYAHGIPREIAEAGYAWWRGRPLRYAAPSWMEFSAFALTGRETNILEEEIEILGPHAPPHTFAWKAGKAPEEFVVCLSPAIPREFCGRPPAKNKKVE